MEAIRMRTRQMMRAVLATGAVALAVSMAGASAATAASGWTSFGSATGIHEVTYVYNGSTTYTSMMNRSGSGIVEQWLTPAVVGGHGAYYQFKPLTYGPWTTPFKMSSDTKGLTYGGMVWTYDRSMYSPTGVLDPYFPLTGQQYWLSGYALSNYATGTVSYKVLTDAVRTITFDVQMSAPGFPATGTMSYSDTDGISYTIAVTAVQVTDTSVTFSGPYPAGSTTQWLVVQLTQLGGVLTTGGDVVTSDPGSTLGSYVPTLQGTDVTGSMTIYTR
jgi:hypothetical protein